MPIVNRQSQSSDALTVKSWSVGATVLPLIRLVFMERFREHSAQERTAEVMRDRNR